MKTAIRILPLYYKLSCNGTAADTNGHKVKSRIETIRCDVQGELLSMICSKDFFSCDVVKCNSCVVGNGMIEVDCYFIGGGVRIYGDRVVS